MSKIPAGATHEGKGERRFYVKDLIPGLSFSFCNEKSDGTFTNWRKSDSGTPLYPITPISRGWNGPEDGLPPVGTACEVDHAEKWVECEVIAHFQNENAPVAVFTFSPYTDKPKVRDCAYYFRHAFRPIRTAEQLAAEEHRAQYMPQLIKLWDADTKRTEFLEAVYALIVEAGKS